MPLIVTPGAADADAYLDLDTVKARWDAEGFDRSNYSDGQLEWAIRNATAWLDGRYEPRFPGKPANGRAQSRSWPRVGAVDRHGETIDDASIPLEVVSAVSHAAKRDVLQPGSLAPDYTRTGQVKRRKVGPIEREFFEPTKPEDSQPYIATVEHAMTRLLTRKLPTAAFATGQIT